MVCMKHFDVFNGDADGLCALHQLRLVTPAEAQLITGTKRDVTLLDRVAAVEGDRVTVLDISLAMNRAALLDLLQRGVEIDYFDHHFAGDVPAHPKLRAVIDTQPRTCTSILVDRHLNGKQRIWAIVGAFGDNLVREAEEMAKPMGLQSGQLAELRELGECLNYNAYGDSEEDLFIHPASLYKVLQRYSDPFRFVHTEAILPEISEGRRRDLELAISIKPEVTFRHGAIYVLPDEVWARRVRGEFSNHLVMASPDSAHAVLTRNAQHGYTVSVRASATGMQNADQLCRQFATGGGRAAAAGINDLQERQLPQFVRAFEHAFDVATQTDPMRRGAR
jgi:hypothetical protein